MSDLRLFYLNCLPARQTVAKPKVDVFAIAEIAFFIATQLDKYVRAPHRRSGTRAEGLTIG